MTPKPQAKPSPKFKNKDGSHTAYSLACGYHQEAIFFVTNSEQYKVTLYQDGCYHVKCKCEIIAVEWWESWTKLSDARKDFAKKVKEIKQALKPIMR